MVSVFSEYLLVSVLVNVVSILVLCVFFYPTNTNIDARACVLLFFAPLCRR